MSLFSRKRKKSGPLGRLLRWTIILIVFGIALDAIYLAVIWPDWTKFAGGAIPKSNFIERYEARQADDSELPQLRWKPVPISQISKAVRRTVIVAEDSRFYTHEGIDTEAVREAIEYNWEHKKLRFGASTLSQQTARNMFLSGSRNPLRKLNEVILTYAMEEHLSKRRILELYLNVAEFGQGIYGVEAAAHYYYGIPASALSQQQAIELAATLPSPVKNNPKTRTKFFRKKCSIISGHLNTGKPSGAPAITPAPQKSAPITAPEAIAPPVTAPAPASPEATPETQIPVTP
ncbi:MAG: monofunctional biosynthetic peptidoglycan transglycosylase [Gammaproteobacteria bacterium]|nr:monofunctional biosynthetic peptidoglycan transglycosylase [Gammaproteobacteria bacterium]